MQYENLQLDQLGTPHGCVAVEADVCRTTIEAPPATIPLSQPLFAGNEWRYVKECLDSGWVSSVGPFVDAFERQFACAVGSRFAIAMSTGTASLHVALRVAGVGEDDEVLMPSLTFIAPANAVRYCGAHPVFFDSESHFWQLDAVHVAGFLRRWCIRRAGSVYNRSTGRRIAAMLPVHILGHPVDLDPLRRLSTEFEIPIVEDATESLGATYHGQRVGTFGLAGCFSFNGNKLLTTGGGGMLVTDDEHVATRARYLSTQARDSVEEYIHNEVGYNYRLTNVQAAIGCAQLEQLEHLLEARRLMAARYRLGLAGCCECLGEAPGTMSSFWLSSIRVDGNVSRGLIRHLRTKGIVARPLWQPLHLSPAYSECRPQWALPVADALYRECVSLPSSPSTTPQEQDQVIDGIRQFLSRQS